MYHPILEAENRKMYLQSILKSMGYTTLQRAGWSHPPQKTYLRQVTFEMLGIQSSSALQNENTTVLPSTHFYWTLGNCAKEGEGRTGELRNPKSICSLLAHDVLLGIINESCVY